jgi:SAM-dependent methyltransferase
MRNAEFNDARLVTVYDAECPWSRDDEYFCSLVDEGASAHVLDFGCGTGRLALGLAARGHRVTGVDPAAASLDAARAKPGAAEVTWLLGSTEVLPDKEFDVALMTSHVAQFFVGDEAWAGCLTALHRSLLPGGRLLFDSRNPDDRRWERWNPVDSAHAVTLPDGSVVHVWTDVTDVTGGDVSFAIHYTFPDTTELVSEATLAFRSEQKLRQSLEVAGFSVDQVHGGWRGEPVGHPDGELLVAATASSTGPRRPTSLRASS